jgi:hypothetical protein
MNQSSQPAFLIMTSLVNIRQATTTKAVEVNTKVTTTVGTTAAGMYIFAGGFGVDLCVVNSITPLR